MGQVERMRGELGEYAHGLKGHIRLLANTAAMAEHLPEVLAAFLAMNPNVDVDLDERPKCRGGSCRCRGACGRGGGRRSRRPGRAGKPLIPD